MKKSVVLILAAIIVTGIAACSKKSSDETPSTTSSLVGTWAKNYQGQTMTMFINADGTYGGTWGSIALPNGHYTIAGNIVTVQDVACNFPGRYSYVLVTDVLTLTLVSDTCDGRYQMTPGTYTRQ